MKNLASKIVVLSGVLSLAAPFAQAVPSFARQTGVACAACHTIFPKLTAFGRQFKLDGYTMAGMKQIKSASSKRTSGLRLDSTLPLSVMLQFGLTHQKKLDPTKQNNATSSDPQEFSVYYAGAISPNTGAFVQITKDGGSTGFGLDMLDIRHTKSTNIGGNSLTYGITLNSGPGMADLWNTTPAWTFPYASTADGVAPETASPLLSGGFMGSGLGVYAMLNHHFYSTFTLYRTNDGGMFPNQKGSIHGVAPFWRFAYQNNFDNGGYLEVGTYGMVTQYNAGMLGNMASGKNDKYTDYAFDAQYTQPMAGNKNLSLHLINVNEKQNLDASRAAGNANTNNMLHQVRLDGSLQIKGAYEFTAGVNQVTGSTDAGPNQNSRSYLTQASYLPWENIKLSAQYIIYDKVNGTSKGASDNNTLYLNAWFMY